MNFGKGALVTAGLLVGFVGSASAQVCPAGVVTPDGFTTITLPMEEFKYRIGEGQTELVLSKRSPITGETETQTQTVFDDPEMGLTVAVLQTNEYTFNQTSLKIVGKVGAALGAVYYAPGVVDVGYASAEGGFIARLSNKTGLIDCLPYPEGALFGDWTKAITVLDLSIADLNSTFDKFKGDLAVCEEDRTRLANENTALKSEISRLQGLLQVSTNSNSKFVYDLSKLAKRLYDDAARGIKNPSAQTSMLTQLKGLRKKLVALRKYNNRNKLEIGKIRQAPATQQ
jgi:hypothetical protein